MNKKQEIGKFGEDKACLFLAKKNYKILERNFNCKYGEIDIIAYSPTRELVFIEVKSRTNLNFGFPSEAVNFSKRFHIYSSSEFFIYSKKIKNMPIRYDIIEVYISSSKYAINHIKNAF